MKDSKAGKVSLTFYVFAIIFACYTAFSLVTTAIYVQSVVSGGYYNVGFSDIIGVYFGQVGPYLFYALMCWAAGYLIKLIGENPQVLVAQKAAEHTPNQSVREDAADAAVAQDMNDEAGEIEAAIAEAVAEDEQSETADENTEESDQSEEDDAEQEKEEEALVEEADTLTDASEDDTDENSDSSDEDSEQEVKDEAEGTDDADTEDANESEQAPEDDIEEVEEITDEEEIESDEPSEEQKSDDKKSDTKTKKKK